MAATATSSGAAKPAAADLGALLSKDDYLRQRISPRRTDIEYLQLKDLLGLIQKHEHLYRGEVFDYGCGGAPYRGFFSNAAAYIKADVTPGPLIDRLLKADCSTGEASASYDFVISTQVLEHIQNPPAYMAEAFRILRPGGKLLLTTHGLIQEHGCPYDFGRWTSRGLEELALSAGFKVLQSYKYTSEIRAFALLLHHSMDHLRCPARPFLHFPLAIIRKIYAALGAPFLNWFADLFPDQAIVPGSSTASLYVGVGILAEKV